MDCNISHEDRSNNKETIYSTRNSGVRDNNQPEISIITPVYNGDRFIETCITNVIRQQCEVCEHLIVDGASTDNTIEIVKDFSRKYPHIRHISEKDSGQSDAMNKGTSLARGRIIGFLNVDDYYEPGVLNRIKEIFENLPEPSLIVGNCNVWGPNNELIYINKPSRLTLYDITSGRPFPVNPSSYFYHKSLHQRIGPFDVDNSHTMDLDFLLRAVQSANLEYVDETWGNFRFIEGTKTYEDQKVKLAFLRLKNLLKKYRKELPFFQRIQSETNFFVFTVGRYLLKILRSHNINVEQIVNHINH